MEEINNKSVKQGWGFRLFNTYVRFILQRIYFRKIYLIHPENVKQDIPLMFISNHQNGMCDPLCLLLFMQGRRKYKVRVVTRAGVFNNPIAGKCLRWLGALPAYRLMIDGEESLSNNKETFSEVEDELLNDGAVIVFPEGKHQDKHWLGEFSTGYLRMLFNAAEKSNFEKEFFIQPVCNHYSDYFAIRDQMLLQYGEPISIKPYYELYKAKPCTAQRELNKLAREKVSDMMLNITDLENYTAIDYIRNTYGIKFAEENHLNPENLPERLQSDKKLVACLDALKVSNAEEIQKIYDEVLELKDKMEKAKIQDWSFYRNYSLFKIFAQGLLFVILLPIFVACYIPNILNIHLPRWISAKVKDLMMRSTVRLFLYILVTIPVTLISIFTLTWVCTKAIGIALLAALCLPLTFLFVIHYEKCWCKWRAEIHVFNEQRKGSLDEVTVLRNRLFETLDTLLLKINS